MSCRPRAPRGVDPRLAPRCLGARRSPGTHASLRPLGVWLAGRREAPPSSAPPSASSALLRLRDAIGWIPAQRGDGPVRRPGRPRPSRPEQRRHARGLLPDAGHARVRGSGGRGAPLSPSRLRFMTKTMGCSASIIDTGGALGVRLISLARRAASALWPCERKRQAAAQREGATPEAPARVRLLLEKVVRHRVRQIRVRRHGRSLRGERRRPRAGRGGGAARGRCAKASRRGQRAPVS